MNQIFDWIYRTSINKLKKEKQYFLHLVAKQGVVQGVSVDFTQSRTSLLILHKVGQVFKLVKF